MVKASRKLSKLLFLLKLWYKYKMTWTINNDTNINGHGTLQWLRTEF